MLIVARSGREKQVVDIFRKWDLDAVVIGKVVEGDRLKVFHNGTLEADLPVIALTDEAPKYERPMAAGSSKFQVPGSRLEEKRDFDMELGTWNLEQALKTLLASPNICSKSWVYEQYDSMVRTNTVVTPGADAAVIRVKETRRAIAMCLDGNGKFVAINAREGARLAVAEAARNVVCVGAKPIAVTNCLNFASPERPEVMRSFSDVIDGMAEACTAFETPVVSGNVSFYNETDGRGILPTPTIGMIGLIDDTRKIITPGFKREGDIIAILGETHCDLAASEFSQTIMGRTTEQLIEAADLPHLDLEREKLVQDTLLRLADEMLLASAHDCSDGGLAVALAESCFSSLGRKSFGAEVNLSSSDLSGETLLFGETPSRIVISFGPQDSQLVMAALGSCPFAILGTVASKMLDISIGGTQVVRADVAELESDWRNSLELQLSTPLNIC
jgi:phosphoribosylformylglycinamidine synthase